MLEIILGLWLGACLSSLYFFLSLSSLSKKGAGKLYVAKIRNARVTIENGKVKVYVSSDDAVVKGFVLVNGDKIDLEKVERIQE